MKKILICGSAGFLMSNLVRYMTYRTKEYEFVSIDCLLEPEYAKLVYINRNHKFYVGDINNKGFMDRIMYIEKPDIIVNGIGCNPGYSVLDLYNTYYLAPVVLSSYDVPTICLSYPEGIIDGSLFRGNLGLILKNNGVIVEIPNCFGFRQKTNFGFANMLGDMIKDKMYLSFTDDKLPWVYAEDVASFIWYIMEQPFFGTRGETVSVPPLGTMSTNEIALIVEEVLGKRGVKTAGELWKPVVKDYKFKDNSSWEPDSKDLREMIKKTIQWYNVNKWILNIGVKNDR